MWNECGGDLERNTNVIVVVASPNPKEAEATRGVPGITDAHPGIYL